jgi:hypothetical protein
MSVTVTAYRIVRSPFPGSTKLEEEVNVLCGQGFEPLGAPYRNEDSGEWCQAMIKRTPEGLHLSADEVRLREPKRK